MSGTFQEWMKACRFPALYLLLWTLLGLAFAGQHFLKSAKLGDTIPWRWAIEGALADWYLFGVLALPSFWLARRFHLGGPEWRLRIALHLVGGAVFSLVWILLRTLLVEPLLPSRSGGKALNDLLRYVVVATFFFNTLVYWVVVTVAHALAYFQSLQDRERRLLEMENRLTSARLQALQMQLNPHFLFNALNGIGTLMYRDVDAADRMLVKLAGLLRHALDQSGQHLVSLKDELSFLDRYLDLEQMRFGDRLTVVREIDPSTEFVLVPNLLLQPIVENAIKHGIEPKMDQGRIIIRSRRVPSGHLRIEIEDNGRGLVGDRGLGSGVGTSNCQARLRQLYGADGSFRLEKAVGGGVLAVVQLPFRIGSGSQSDE
jgi:two-component system LytT family sensor kinase